MKPERKVPICFIKDCLHSTWDHISFSTGEKFQGCWKNNFLCIKGDLWNSRREPQPPVKYQVVKIQDQIKKFQSGRALFVKRSTCETKIYLIYMWYICSLGSTWVLPAQIWLLVTCQNGEYGMSHWLTTYFSLVSTWVWLLVKHARFWEIAYESLALPYLSVAYLSMATCDMSDWGAPYQSLSLPYLSFAYLWV